MLVEGSTYDSWIPRSCRGMWIFNVVELGCVEDYLCCKERCTMSYQGMQGLLDESKTAASSSENSWLIFTEKEIERIQSSWREAAVRQSLEALYEEEVLDHELLTQFFTDLRSTLSAFQESELLQIWEDEQLSEDEKAIRLLHLASDIGYFDVFFIKLMPRVMQLFSKDQDFFTFLRDPQRFIDENVQFTAYDKQCLEFIAKDPTMEKLEIAKHVRINSNVETELTKAMKGLNLQDYGCRDALRFEHCINPEAKDNVLLKAQKSYHGPAIIGMGGALEHYDRNLIKKTAKVVEQTKMGECHTLAQLAAECFFSLNDKKQLNINVKMVCHEAQLGSHTFLLVNHNELLLDDLSNCLIIDPWAYAMGYTETEGIFTIDNYPYPAMTTNLVCCYDSRGVEHQSDEFLSPSGTKMDLK